MSESDEGGRRRDSEGDTNVSAGWRRSDSAGSRHCDSAGGRQCDSSGGLLEQRTGRWRLCYIFCLIMIEEGRV